METVTPSSVWLPQREEAGWEQGGNRRDNDISFSCTVSFFIKFFRTCGQVSLLRPFLAWREQVPSPSYRQKKRCTNMSMLCPDDESLWAEAAFMLRACAAPVCTSRKLVSWLYLHREGPWEMFSAFPEGAKMRPGLTRGHGHPWIRCNLTVQVINCQHYSSDIVPP